jgi:hypothetical protein
MASRALRARRAIRSITFTAARFGGSATMRFAEGRAFPLATKKAAERLLFFCRAVLYIMYFYIRNYGIT